MLFVAALTPVLLLARAVEQNREAARRAQCTSHMKGLIVWLHFYHESKRSFPTGTIPNPALAPEHRLGWMAELSLAPTAINWAIPSLDRAKGWDEAPNWPLKLVVPRGAVGVTPWVSFRNLTCPNDPANARKTFPQPLSYIGVAGLGADAPSLPTGHPRAGVFGYDRATRLGDITDGTDRTMMLVETARDIGPWTAGGPLSVRGIDPKTRPYVGDGRPFGGYHPGGVNVAFADGSIQFLRATIDPRVFEALSTIAGHEPLPADWDR
jgi:prepilin-type processing-associated H-X9-DG protein